MPNIDEVEEYLRPYNIDVWRYEKPTPTAVLAAEAVGCTVAEIAKTLLFLVGGEPVIVVTSGDMKVRSSLLKKATGLSGKVKLPQFDDVKEITGYAPGGVCPFMLPPDLPVFLDKSLCRFERVYAAAGDDASAVPVTMAELAHITAGSWVEACADPD